VTDLPLGDATRRDRRAPLVLDALTETRTGRHLGPAEVAAGLDGVGILLVGEEHADPNSHEAQRRLLAALVGRGRRVILGLEMLPRDPDVQTRLDDFVAGRIDERTFVRTSGWYRHWGFGWSFYRDIFLLARAEAVPIVGLNLPRELVSAVARGGLASLSAEQRKALPPRIDVGDPQHRALFEAYMREAGDAHGGLSGPLLDRMFEAQCTWDAVMATHALEILEARGADPEAIVVVLVGRGHVAYGLGIARQAALAGGVRVASAIPVALTAEPPHYPAVRASYADFVWTLPPAPEDPYPTLGVSLEGKDGEPPAISFVRPEGPAARAGLQRGDRLASVDGAPVIDREDFLLGMSGKRWGDVLAVEVDREGRRLSLRVPLRRPGPPPR
jgi:uncharacterized iron-regulated protein